jgi:hypothetical protein
MIRYKWALVTNSGEIVSPYVYQYGWDDTKHSAKGRLKMCGNGYHCCRTAKQLGLWSPWASQILLMRVEVSGGHLNRSDKEVWRHCKIVGICVLNKKQRECFPERQGKHKLHIKDCIFLPFDKAKTKIMRTLK